MAKLVFGMNQSLELKGPSSILFSILQFRKIFEPGPINYEYDQPENRVIDDVRWNALAFTLRSCTERE